MTEQSPMSSEERLRKALETVEYELAALAPNPSAENPDWMLALGNSNPADAKCLTIAYEAVRAALASTEPAQAMTEQKQLEEIRQIAGDDLDKHGACSVLERIEQIAANRLLSRERPAEGEDTLSPEEFMDYVPPIVPDGTVSMGVKERKEPLEMDFDEPSTTEGEREKQIREKLERALSKVRHVLSFGGFEVGKDLYFRAKAGEREIVEVLALLAQPQEQGEREGWTCEVKYFRSFLCACGYMGREYDSGLLICTKCGFGRHPDFPESAGGEDGMG